MNRIALVSMLALGCAGVRRSAPPTALSAPGLEPGTRAFLVDDLGFGGPDWPARVVKDVVVIEEPGACQKTRYMGLPSRLRLHGWTPETSCARVVVTRAPEQFLEPSRCETELDRWDSMGQWRYATSWRVERVSLGGRPARHYEVVTGIGTEAVTLHEYDVCWGTEVTFVAIEGRAGGGDDLESVRKRVVETLKWEAVAVKR